MNAVEVFLLFVVGFSVLVFLIIDHFDSSFDKRSKGNSRCGGGGIESRVEERISVGDEGEGGREEIDDDLGKEIGVAEEEERGCGGRVRFAAELGFSGEGEGGIGDDWEGIERSELEKTFGEAVVFVSCHGNADEIAVVKMDLYGLQQVALQGPCHGSQPMAFNIPARSRWNAWQRLGDMSREVAMETYIEILSKAIPGWKGKDKQNASAVKDQTPVKQNECTSEGKTQVL